MVEGILSQFQINAPTYKYIHLTSTCVHMLATSDIIQQLFPYSDIAITSTISLKFQQPRLYLDYSNMYKQSMFKQKRLLQKIVWFLFDNILSLQGFFLLHPLLEVCYCLFSMCEVHFF